MRADARRNRDRILAAANQVFAARGAAASTEEVAAEAGVAIGTVFRHFPTKQDLLAAILKDLLAELTAAAADDDLFGFFTRVVTAAAEKKFVVELLEGDFEIAQPIQTFAGAVERLLADALATGTVRDGVRLDEVLALLTAASQGALHGGWSPDLLHRTLAVIFAGLRG